MQVLEEEEESDALRKINHVIVMQPLKPGKVMWLHNTM